VIGTLVVDGWTVTFGTARRGLGGLRPRLFPGESFELKFRGRSRDAEGVESRSRRRRRRGRGAEGDEGVESGEGVSASPVEVGSGEGAVPLPRKIFEVFILK